MSKALGKDVINKLLKQEAAKKTPDPTGSIYKERWPGEVNLVKLARAVKHGRDMVVFRNGDRFNIVHRTPDLVLLKPEFGFAPMGYFTRKALQEAEAKGIDLDNGE